MSTANASRAVTRLTGISYDVYVKIRDARGNNGLRMAYNDGVLEIMSPEFRHEKGGRRLFVLVFAYCAEFELACAMAGATTFRKGLPGELKGKGKEPDESFYLGAAAPGVLRKETLDLTVDPPPSLWVEVDNRASSKAKLPLYAALGVPEVWRYRPRSGRLWFGRLDRDHYEEITASLALPGLTRELVKDALTGIASRDDSAWDRWLRGVWFPAHRQELIARGAGGPSLH
jgi:Uma2 family endonuclease